MPEKRQRLMIIPHAIEYFLSHQLGMMRCVVVCLYQRLVHMLLYWVNTDYYHVCPLLTRALYVCCNTGVK